VGNYPEESIQLSEHAESLKSRINQNVLTNSCKISNIKFHKNPVRHTEMRRLDVTIHFANIPKHEKLFV